MITDRDTRHACLDCPYLQQAIKGLHLLLRAERLRPEPAATVQREGLERQPQLCAAVGCNDT